MGKLLDKYRLVHKGDFLREFAREHNLFIYPYDLETGADIALYENTEAKEKTHRYYVCSLEEAKPRQGRKGPHEAPLVCDMIYQCRPHCAASFEGALQSWNLRMQKRLQILQYPFWQRFFVLELDGIVKNAGVYILIYCLLDSWPFLDHLVREYAWPLVVAFFICNLEHLFTKSYGSEIPRRLLSRWQKAPQPKFAADFYEEAMEEWQEVREKHEESLPIYLRWRRDMLPTQEDGQPLPETLPEEQQAGESSYEVYCREILDTLAAQAGEIKDRQTKIADRAIRQQVEKILKLLGEIRLALGAGEKEAKVIAARKVTSYWNEETLSLLDNYLLFVNNSSREARENRERILSLLQDLAPVYRKELGRITATDAMELKASMDVLQQEIDEVLRKPR